MVDGAAPITRRFTTRERFELAGATGFPIRGEVVHPDGAARGTVVVCHGFKGFFRGGFFPYLADQLAAARFRAIVFNFSGSGVGEDLENFTEPDAFFANSYVRELRDLDAVVAEGAHRGWIGASYGLFGHSRGGGGAILHAARAGAVASLVTWAAIANVGRWTADDMATWRERGSIDVLNTRTRQVLQLGTITLDEIERLASADLDILAAASRVRVPWLIAHGTADETVSVDDAMRLKAASPAGSTALLLVEGAGHTFDIRHPMTTPSPALERVTAATVAFYGTTLG